VTRAVVLDVTFNKAEIRAADKKEAARFSARGHLKGPDFGMKTFLPYIGDHVELLIETEGHDKGAAESTPRIKPAV
jgi:polyisoprenoid-binding protein YceI